jgi:tetratricopeptide (TPR) repeat protein
VRPLATTKAVDVAARRTSIVVSRGFFAAALLFACCVQFAPAITAAETPAAALNRQFQAARAALEAGDLAQAEAQYRATLALGLRQLGNLAISEGRYAQATQFLDKAVELTPQDADLHVEAAIAWFRSGDSAKAADLIQAVLAQHPENARAHNVLGRIQLFAGDADAAISELQKSVELQDDFETAYFIGVAYLKAKKLSEASAWFQQLQAHVGNSAALHVLFGRAYSVTHFPQPAIAEFRKAIDLDPQYPRAHGLLGYSYLELYGEQSYPQARQEFERELKLRPDQYYFLMLLGIATVSLRDFPAAEAALKHAIRLNPHEPGPYLYLGETYSETQRSALAVQALQKYVSLVADPEEMPRDVSRAYYLLGQSLMHMGRVEEAKKALLNSQKYREAKFRYDAKHIFDEKPSTQGADSRASERIEGLLEASAPGESNTTESIAQGGVQGSAVPDASAGQSVPESPPAKQYRAFVSEILASSYNDLGVMRAKNSQFAEAAEFFKQAHAWNPALPGLDRNYGLAAYRAEMYSEAIAPLERRLAAHPDDAFVRQILALSYFDQENYSKVAEVLRPLQSNPPDDPALLFALGTALVRTRQSADAAKIFQRMLQQNATNPGVHYLLGQAYAQDKEYPNALTELKAAIRLDPKLPEAHYYTGLVYLHQTDFDNAAQEFRAELALRPGDPVTTYHLAFALLSLGQTEEAATLLHDVVKTKPDYELAHFELGRALLQQGDVNGAIASLETARKLQPDRELTYFQLSQAYRRAGRAQDAEEALATYRKMIEASRQKKRQSLETETP